MNELVEPFQETDIDDEEFACLKAIVFFDPNIAGLQKADEVRKVRKQVQVNLSKNIPFFFLATRQRSTSKITLAIGNTMPEVDSEPYY